jgi:hypothetical protein
LKIFILLFGGNWKEDLVGLCTEYRREEGDSKADGKNNYECKPWSRNGLNRLILDDGTSKWRDTDWSVLLK